MMGALDARRSGYSRRGSLLQATLHDYRQRSGDGLSFRRMDAVKSNASDPPRHLGRLSRPARLDDGPPVATSPFFLMPQVGGERSAVSATTGSGPPLDPGSPAMPVST
jgi:hypothetical protein